MELPLGRQRTDHRRSLSVRVLGALTLLAGACSSDPVYFGSEPEVLSSEEAPAGDAGPPMLVLKVPIAIEDESATAKRTDLAMQLGLQPDDVPKARRSDTDLEVEFSITNLDAEQDGTVRLYVTAANEFFRYDPGVFVDPTDEEAEPPPPIYGGPTGRPIMVPAGKMVTGIIREDELYEAAQDLDAITRAGVIPETALLTRWTSDDIVGGEGGQLATVPGKAVPLILELDLRMLTNVSAELRATLRVRDRSGRLRPTEQDPALLIPASTTVFLPAAPAPLQ